MKPVDAPSTTELAQDATFKHERQLVYCRQMARPVLYQGFQRFIAGAHLPWGETEMHFFT